MNLSDSWFSNDAIKKKKLKFNSKQTFAFLPPSPKEMDLLACFQLGSVLCFENRAV